MLILNFLQELDDIYDEDWMVDYHLLVNLLRHNFNLEDWENSKIFKNVVNSGIIRFYDKYLDTSRINNTAYSVRNFFNENHNYPDNNIYQFYELLDSFKDEFFEENFESSDYDYYLDAEREYIKYPMLISEDPDDNNLNSNLNTKYALVDYQVDNDTEVLSNLFGSSVDDDSHKCKCIPPKVCISEDLENCKCVDTNIYVLKRLYRHRCAIVKVCTCEINKNCFCGYPDRCSCVDW